MAKVSSNEFPSNPFNLSDESPPPPAVAPRTPPRVPDGGTASQAALKRFISARDLSVVFQPIIRLATGDVFAYEALVRCELPEYVSPPALFERAVRDRCVGRLGKTIREVGVPLCEGVPVFFNIHPEELQDRWLLRPDDPIYQHDAPVFLEITESVPLQHFTQCKRVLSEIRERADARLVVDDLGAGYSNLRYIVDLEPAVVKLDRELIAGIHTQKRVQRLVGAIVRLCDELDAEVVAEGIETAEELAAVRDQGVQLVQGYHLARPGFPLPMADRVKRDARGRAVLGPTRWARSRA
jgi:EAL domain-containing protein (putative c-di-GMP-specific phosphodiesterase class I)